MAPLAADRSGRFQSKRLADRAAVVRLPGGQCSREYMLVKNKTPFVSFMLFMLPGERQLVDLKRI